MKMAQKPETKEIKSPLSIYEWFQFIEDECDSLKEEKRFLFTQWLASITTISILVWILIELFFSQRIFGFKIIFLSWLLIFFILIYRVFLLVYVIMFRGHVMRIIDIPIGFGGNDNIALIQVIFIIIFAHRLSPLMSLPTMPIDILKSTTYFILLLFSFIEALSGAYVLFSKYEKLEAIGKSLEGSGENSYKWIIAGMIPLLITIGLTGWVLFNLEQPPDELLEIQVKISLIILSILFISVYWAMPLYQKLKMTTDRIAQLSKQIDGILLGKITAPDEILLKGNGFKE